MVVAKRIIPCLDVDRGRVVKGIHFRDLRDAGDPAALGARYSREGADELVFLDITASPERRDILRKMVESVAANIDIPFTVGGGIRSISDAKLVLTSGADKVSMNTAAVERPALVKEVSEKFGQQCVVVAIDAKRRDGEESDKTVVQERDKKFWFEVHTYGGRNATELDAIGWAKEVERLGAGELLVTSIDRDGTEQGYDIALLKAIAANARIPVIASGGCGRLGHFLEVFTKTDADAALAASIFHYDKIPIKRVKNFLRRMGVVVRP